MTNTIDISQQAFTRRFAHLLAVTRQHSDLSLHHLARLSAGRFTLADLERLEAGADDLDDSIAAEAAALYGADLDLILPVRPPLLINGNVLSSGAASTVFNPVDSRSLLASYLVVLRQLRHHQADPTVAVRHADIETLAAHVGLPGWVVVERLSELLELGPRQRRSMVDLFNAGAAVIALLGH